jgi:hypothetical protein
LAPGIQRGQNYIKDYKEGASPDLEFEAASSNQTADPDPEPRSATLTSDADRSEEKIGSGFRVNDSFLVQFYSPFQQRAQFVKVFGFKLGIFTQNTAIYAETNNHNVVFETQIFYRQKQ